LICASSVDPFIASRGKHYAAIFSGPPGLKASLPLSLIVRDVRGVAGYAVALADDAVLAAFG
jgi:hypothetical protein